MLKSSPSRFGWDLSEENILPNTEIQQAIEKELAKVKFSSKRFMLNLSYSRLSSDHVCWIIGLLEKYEKLDVNIGFCGLSITDVLALLIEKKHPKWFEEGRVTMATTSLELTVEKFIVATNKRCKVLEDWQDVEDKALEEEVTKAVKSYLAESGFADVRGVPLKKLYGADGNVLIEMDGLLAAIKDKQQFLITVEAKHKVTTGKIEDRVKQNNKLQALLSELREGSIEDLESKGVAAKHIDCCSVLIRYAKAGAQVLHFIGGVHFSEADANLARKGKFHIVTREGDAFRVTPYR